LELCVALDVISCEVTRLPILINQIDAHVNELSVITGPVKAVASQEEVLSVLELSEIRESSWLRLFIMRNQDRRDPLVLVFVQLLVLHWEVLEGHTREIVDVSHDLEQLGLTILNSV